MSGSNAEVVRRWNEAFSRGDLDALIPDFGPESEWVVAREHPAATTHRGPDEIRLYLEDWRRTMPGMTAEVESLEERGDRVLTIARMRGAGAESGAGTEVVLAIITTFRDGRPIRTEEYLDPAEARRIFES